MKFYRSILYSLLIIFFLLNTIWANELAYKNGNLHYDKKEYNLAIDQYKLALKGNPQKYAAVVNYKIALAYIKMKSCFAAKEHFALAYKADAVKGGASSYAKFLEKIKECSFSLDEIKTYTINASKQTAEKNEAETTVNKTEDGQADTPNDTKVNIHQGEELADTPEKKGLPWYVYLLGAGGIGAIAGRLISRLRKRPQETSFLQQRQLKQQQKTGYEKPLNFPQEQVKYDNEESDYQDHS